MTVSDQVELLSRRGLKTDSRTAWVLEREGYYSIINGYKGPFLDTEQTQEAGDDRYRDGTSFNDVYMLYLFDRNLRFLLFRMTTLAEAILKTVCSHEFTRLHSDEKNPYLNIANYAPEGEAHDKAEKLMSKLDRILQGNMDPKRTDRKDYLRHCLEHHDGEVPLWVLANDLTLGQIYWFFQSRRTEIRANIARSFTSLYANSHKHKTEVTSQRLDKIYRRIRDYRNICAHDERLYCARPHDANITISRSPRISGSSQTSNGTLNSCKACTLCLCICKRTSLHISMSYATQWACNIRMSSNVLCRKHATANGDTPVHTDNQLLPLPLISRPVGAKRFSRNSTI